MNNLKLYGAWPSPFSNRVIWALKLKGINYEYIEEDLTNKSSLLIHYNPVYKKIPVLVHNGESICESMIILEYLELMWPLQFPLLPNEPYEKSMVRFWANFVEEKGIAIWILFRTKGVDHEKAKKDCLDMLRTIEDQAMTNKNIFFEGKNIGIADLAFGSLIYWLQVIELTVDVKLFEANNFPRLHKWLNNFKEVPIIKSNLPDQHQMYLFFKKKREELMQLEATSL